MRIARLFHRFSTSNRSPSSCTFELLNERLEEVIADEQAQHWSRVRPEACFHLDKHLAFLRAEKDIKAGFVSEVAETGVSTTGALMDEVERRPHAKVRGPIAVDHGAKPIGALYVHREHVGQLAK